MKDWIYDSAPYWRGNPALGQWGLCRSESLARGHTSCSRTPSTSSTVLQTFAPAVLHLSSNNALPFSYLALRASTIRDFSACLQYIGNRKNSSTPTAPHNIFHHEPGFLGLPPIHWQQKNQQHRDSPDDLLPPAPGKPQASPQQRCGKADIEPANGAQDVCACAEFKHGRTRASWRGLWMTTIPNGHCPHPCPTDQNSSLSSSRSTASAPGPAHLARGVEQG